MRGRSEILSVMNPPHATILVRCRDSQAQVAPCQDFPLIEVSGIPPETPGLTISHEKKDFAEYQA